MPGVRSAAGADNTPSCDCRQRASEALLHTRTAEAAAAEDFDPLRIRPYVELEGAETETGAGAAAGAGNDDVRHPGVPAESGSGPEASAGAATGAMMETAAGTAAGTGVPPAEVTMALRAVPPGRPPQRDHRCLRRLLCPLWLRTGPIRSDRRPPP